MVDVCFKTVSFCGPELTVPHWLKVLIKLNRRCLVPCEGRLLLGRNARKQQAAKLPSRDSDTASEPLHPYTVRSAEHPHLSLRLAVAPSPLFVSQPLST